MTKKECLELTRRYIVVMHGGLEPEIVGPVVKRIDYEIVDVMRKNKELGPEGEDSFFVLNIPDQGRPTTKEYASWYVDKLRARAYRMPEE